MTAPTRQPDLPSHSQLDQARLAEILGYLNFSSGSSDGKFLAALSELYAEAEAATEPGQPAIDWLFSTLRKRLEKLASTSPAFANPHQARHSLDIVQKQFLPEYRRFHYDLLWHRSDAELWRPFMLGRVFEVVLSQGPPWDEVDRIVPVARDLLDDYIGYRPIPVLESQKVEAYRHEWVRPIPLYLASAGFAYDEHRELLEMTLKILRETDPDLLGDAWFNPELIEELSLDPRAYDFDHPVNRRPNYHFGQWDPNCTDRKGYYKRFVLQPLSLSCLWSRVTDADASSETAKRPREELVFEAAAVLAGTMLMASGTSGNRPNCHGSDVTLGTLLPTIADYRDRFYAELLERATGPHGDRLRAEARRCRQPFGAARQHLNQTLAHRRSLQLQKVHLAQVYARMGYADKALAEARSVRVASARMLCQIYCRLTDGHHAIDRRRLGRVITLLDEIDDLLNRGIECGAFVDPWNIIGFGANFSLFPALENSVHDYRADDLVQLVEQTLDLASRACAEAAAVDDRNLESGFAARLAKLADWWDQYGAYTVSGIKDLVAKDVEISTNLVAGALSAWYKAGAAAGDIGFWSIFVDQFDSPKAFQLVIEALLDKNDLVASMGLMMQWVSQTDYTPLEDGDASFHSLALRWLLMVEARIGEADDQHWSLVARFFAYLEANAEQFWHVPEFDLVGRTHRRYDVDELFGDGDEDSDDDDETYDDDYDDEQEDDELDNLFSAAYDEVTFRDSTDDGFDSAILDSGFDDTEYELEEEGERLRGRLAFLTTVARLWRQAATAWTNTSSQRIEQLEAWHREAVDRYTQLIELLETVHRHRIPAPRSNHESMVEYDRRRTMKETLVERIIATCVEMSDAGRLLRAAAGIDGQPTGEGHPLSAIARTIEILRALIVGDKGAVRIHWPLFKQSLVEQELLYLPLGKGGSPPRIVKARALHQLIYDLLGWLPRLGMIRETCQLLQVAQQMEAKHPVGSGAVTEYDRLFEQGYQAMVRCLVSSASEWPDVPPNSADDSLVESLWDLTETQLTRWLEHSSTVRLSVVEKLTGRGDWQKFVSFVERYGKDLFTQQRLSSPGNLRAILHQPVEQWIAQMERDGDDDAPRLLDELDGAISRAEAIEQLTLALEIIVENYREYRDYNSTTTQSDHGELLYTFIDFLRLRADYDRTAWQLKPVYYAHEILIREGHVEAAELWCQALALRTHEKADHYETQFEKLCDKYGMRLPGIAERLAERFIRPLTVARLRALAAPAIDAIDRETESPEFTALTEEITELLAAPSGAGIDVPDWILALEEEVTDLRRRKRNQHIGDELLGRTLQVKLPWETVVRELQVIRSEQSKP